MRSAPGALAVGLALGLPLGATGCRGLAAALSPPERLLPDPPGARAWSAPAGPLEVGAAAVDVTPPGPVLLGGFGIWRRSEGVLDPLWARAVAWRRGDVTVVVVAVDVVGLHHHHVARVRARLAARVPRGAVLVCATHTHSGPDTLGLWGLPPVVSGIDDVVLAQVLDGVARAAERALDDLGPAVARWARAETPPRGVSRNRRDPARIDRRATAVAFDRPDGAPVATLLHFACHPEGLGKRNRLVSSDFAHALRARVEEARGGVAVFVNGALGGMVTTDEAAHSPAEVARIGAAVAEVALAALADGATGLPLEPDLAVAIRPVRVPVQNRRFHLGDAGGLFDGRPFEGGATTSEVMAVRLGPLVLLTAPGEALPRLGDQLLARARGDPALLVGLGNDELGYLIPDDEWHEDRYRYERTVSPGPLVAPLLRAAAARALADVDALALVARDPR